MDRERIRLESYPIDLIDKDWSKRELFFKPNSKDFLDKVHDLAVRYDDVWIVTYPKCGTTWMQELLWLLINNCSLDTALATDLEVRTPFLEFDRHGDADKAIHLIQNLPAPRLIKTHLPMTLLPVQLLQGRAKVVYVSRNYSQTLRLSFDQEILRKTIVELNPIAHFSEFYQIRHEHWLFYTSFERVKSDLRSY